jgi:hypothetical protein
MADGEIKEQMENWKEEHPEAEAAPAAPDAPCFKCERKAGDVLALKSVLFNTAYDTLRQPDVAKIVLITEDQCPPCEDASQIFESLIKEGAIEVLPYSKCTPGDKECIAAQGITSVPVLASRNADGTIRKFFPLAGPSTAVSLKKAAPYIEVIAERLAEEFPGETMDEARQKAGL